MPRGYSIDERYEKQCVYCEKDFVTHLKLSLYCSLKCREKAKYLRVKSKLTPPCWQNKKETWEMNK